MANWAMLNSQQLTDAPREALADCVASKLARICFSIAFDHACLSYKQVTGQISINKMSLGDMQHGIWQLRISHGPNKQHGHHVKNRKNWLSKSDNIGIGARLTGNHTHFARYNSQETMTLHWTSAEWYFSPQNFLPPIPSTSEVTRFGIQCAPLL